MDTELRTTPPVPVAVIRRRTTPEGVAFALGGILPAVFGAVAEAQVPPAGAPFARYFTSTDSEVDFEAGLPLAAPFSGKGAVQAGELPGGETLVVRHVGSYDTVFTAHDEASRWCAEHGRSPAGPPWETYLTDPGEEPDPGKWVTEVSVPLA